MFARATTAGLLSWLLLAATAVAHEGHDAAGHDGGPDILLIVVAIVAAVILALTMALFWLWRTGRIR
ncbi:MAG: hypothetical protein IIB19_03665 [Chloroflexi bacterium]|nr:hypothetical protein [Chloroflexota bacterium]